jgi:CyaY protein
MNESEFNALAERIFAAVGEAIDSADSDLDWNLNEGVLEIECPDGSKIILSRHTLNRELWLAAKSGGYHYRSEGGAWRDTRGGDTLAQRLAQALREQGGAEIALPEFAI